VLVQTDVLITSLRTGEPNSRQFFGSLADHDTSNIHDSKPTSRAACNNHIINAKLSADMAKLIVSVIMILSGVPAAGKR